MTVPVERVRDILSTARIDGAAVSIDTPLDRAEYVAVNKVLEAVGGKWNRKAKAHLFPTDPAAALGEFLTGGSAPKHARTAEGYVATPTELAAKIVSEHTRIAGLAAGSAVLEPSAGDGAFVRAIAAANPSVRVTAVEPSAERLGSFPDVGNVDRCAQTFETFAEQNPDARFDAVVMNPPFAVPGQPTIWIDHVRLAFDLLSHGARLTAIVPAGALFRADRRHTAMRELIDAHGGVRELPDAAFRSSGTDVRTAILWLDKSPRA